MLDVILPVRVSDWPNVIAVPCNVSEVPALAIAIDAGVELAVLKFADSLNMAWKLCEPAPRLFTLKE